MTGAKGSPEKYGVLQYIFSTILKAPQKWGEGTNMKRVAYEEDKHRWGVKH